MNLRQYLPLAMRTEATAAESPLQRRLLHAAIGLSTESAELLDSTSPTNMLEELGDLCWYCAIIYNALGLNPDHDVEIREYSSTTHIRILVAQSGIILDFMKKVEFYGADLDKYRGEIEALTHCIISHVAALAVQMDSTLSNVLEANVRKLAVRYPSRFTKEAALNRDLQSEYKALEG